MEPDPLHSSPLVFALSLLLFSGLCWRFRSRLAEFSLFCGVLLIPLAHAWFMPQNVLGVPGLSLLNVILLVAALSLLQRASLSEAMREFPRYFTPSLLTFLFLFYVAIARTGMDIESLLPRDPAMRPTAFRVVVLDGILAMKYVVFGSMVALYGILHRSLEPASKALVALPILLLPLVVVAFALGVWNPGSDQPLYDYGRNSIARHLALHGNDLGRTAIYLLLFALIARDLPWQRLRGPSLACSLALIELSFSRTAWITAALVLFLLYRRISRRDCLWLAASLVIVTLALLPFLEERAKFGFEPSGREKQRENEIRAGSSSPKDESSGVATFHRVMAGRTGNMWPRLLPNFLAHPWVGQGFYSVWKPADPEAKRFVYNHPHNAYLEVALDMGVLGLVALAWLLSGWWTLGSRYPPWRYVLGTWLFMSISGGSFYPELQNALNWVWLGMAVATAAAAPRENPSPRKRTLFG